MGLSSKSYFTSVIEGVLSPGYICFSIRNINQKVEFDYIFMKCVQPGTGTRIQNSEGSEFEGDSKPPIKIK